MTFEEFSNKYEEYLLKLVSKKDFPRWFDIQLKTQGSRNITIDSWNHVITLLGYIASDDHASTELLDGIVKVLNTLKEQLSDKLDVKPFTSSDSGKFVAIGPDGSFVTVHPPDEEDEEDPTVPAWAKQPNKPTYTASEVGAASADDLIALRNADTTLGQRITDEISARESGDTAVNNRLTTELSSLETRLGESLQTYLSITQAADSEIKDLAVGIPTYDETTGKITFETLSGRYTTIDLILMSMLTNVRFDEANNEIVFSFRTHEGVESEIRVPLGDLTLPAWTTRLNTIDPNQLSVPPTTQAVRNALIYFDDIIGGINNSLLSRSDVQQMIDTSLGVIENGSY